MKIYLAGFGHPIEQTPFIDRKDVKPRFLISFWYINIKDRGFLKRLEWIKERKQEVIPNADK
jgi:hypothetical protein